MKTHPCVFILLAFIVSAATGVIARVTGMIWIAVAGDVVFFGVLLAVVVQWLKGRTRKAVGTGGTPRRICQECPCHTVSDEPTCKDCVVCCPEYYDRRVILNR